MRSLCRFVLALLVLGSFVCVAENAEAGWFRRTRVMKTQPRGKVSSARPVTGYGANLHRRFVLKQELQRAERGQRVRYRGNIRWYR